MHCGFLLSVFYGDALYVEFIVDSFSLILQRGYNLFYLCILAAFVVCLDINFKALKLYTSWLSLQKKSKKWAILDTLRQVGLYHL
jgi:hypothetical protein